LTSRPSTTGPSRDSGDGYARAPLIHLDAGGAFLAEVILTALFVFVILGVTSKVRNAVTAGMMIGPALTVIHLSGIALMGTSVNPARSQGPAPVGGGTALSQLWLFIVARLVVGALAALLHRILYPAVETL
jgi:aquaporin Z